MSLDFESMQSMENLQNANAGIKIKDYNRVRAGKGVEESERFVWAETDRFPQTSRPMPHPPSLVSRNL